MTPEQTRATEAIEREPMARLTDSDLDALDEVIASWQHSERAWAPMRLADVSMLIAEVRSRHAAGEPERKLDGWSQPNPRETECRVGGRLVAWTRVDNRERWYWVVWGGADLDDEIAEGVSSSAAAAEAAATLWIRANPDKVPFRLPEERVTDSFPRAPRDEDEFTEAERRECVAVYAKESGCHEGEGGDCSACFAWTEDILSGGVEADSDARRAVLATAAAIRARRNPASVPGLVEELRGLVERWRARAKQPGFTPTATSSRQAAIAECASDLTAILNRAAASATGGGER
jgi:hypothetical protein